VDGRRLIGGDRLVNIEFLSLTNDSGRELELEGGEGGGADGY